MLTLCRAYPTDDAAAAAVARLVDAGVPGDQIRVLMGAPVRDHRDEPTGRFGGADSPDVTGSFDDVERSARDGMGSFAGAADRQRRGGFGDLDRETVTSYRNGVARIHVTSHRNLKQMLVDGGLDSAAADADVDALHDGRVLVLVRTGSLDDEDVAHALDAAA